MSLHRRLHVAADTIAGTLPHLWRPEWAHIHTAELAGLLGEVFEPYSRIAAAVEAWWTAPGREGWDCPAANHAEEFSAACGWDITDSLGYADPLLPWVICADWIGKLADRLCWWRLVPTAQGILTELEQGLPPGRDLLAVIADVLDGTPRLREVT